MLESPNPTARRCLRATASSEEAAHLQPRGVVPQALHELLGSCGGRHGGQRAPIAASGRLGVLAVRSSDAAAALVLKLIALS